MNLHSRDSTPRALLSTAASFVCLTAIVWLLPGGRSTCAEDDRPDRLTARIIDRSLALGTEYLVNSQRTEGNFVYEYDFVAGSAMPTDNAVRQAGAFWGLTMAHLANPSRRTREAASRGLAFFEKHTKLNRSGVSFPVYTKQSRAKTNVPALLVLGLVDLLRADDLDKKLRRRAERLLDQYLRLLVSLRRHDGFFCGYYDDKTGQGMGMPSPYADGEALLALARAAKYAGHEEFKARILDSARMMHQRYVVSALERDPDSSVTKGFYQWGSMAFFEIHDAGWANGNQFARHTIEMAHWMIDVHRVLTRTRNTAYAFEGIAVAWELARRTGDEQSTAKFADAIDRGLYKLTSWQVGGPVPNRFLQSHATNDPKAVGGVMNGATDPVLRIDVTQHQMHALILARRFLHPES